MIVLIKPNVITVIIVIAMIFACLGSLLLGAWHLGRPVSGSANEQADQDSVTLFLPGYLGSRFSFGFLLKRLVKNYHADKALVVIVKRDGRLKLYGSIKRGRCVVQVLFEDKTSRPSQQAEWLDHLCQTLQKRYRVASLNLVGHSMGCITIFWYLTHQHRNATVSIDKVVAIAGPFNDSEIARNTVAIDSIPLTAAGPIHKRPIYSALAANISQLPPTIKVLNIAGRISDSQKNDGQVSVNSAFSLRFLLKRPLGYYHEMIVRGRRASHRLLHENRLVDNSIAEFLWH